MLLTSKRYLACLLLFIALVGIFPYTWTDGSARFDPYTYSGAAAYLAAGNTLFPEHHDRQEAFLFFDHPMLFKWMQAGFFKIFGISEYTAKLLPGGMAVLTVLAVFLIGHFFFSMWTGFFAGLFLVLSPRFLAHAAHCMLDIPLVLFISVSIFSAFYAAERNKRFYLLSGLAMGAAILIKGPFGLLPAPVIVFHLMISKKWKEFLNITFWLGALLPHTLMVVHDWMLSYHHPHIIFDLFWRTKGFSPSWDPFFYVRALFERYGYLLPFAGAAVYGYFRLKNETQKKFMLSLGFWAAATLIPLSVMPSKKQGYYLLPMNPALALLCGIAVDLFLKAEHKKRIVRWILALTAAAYMIFSLTPLKLHKYKVLKRQAYYKQFYEMNWLLMEIASKRHTIYYSDGFQFILNFNHSGAFQKDIFLPISRDNASAHIQRLKKRSQKVYFLVSGKFSDSVSDLELVARTKDLLLVVNK